MQDTLSERYRELVGELLVRRREHCFPLKVRSSTRRFGEDVLAVLFPHFSENVLCGAAEIEEEIHRLEAELVQLGESLDGMFNVPPPQRAHEFLQQLPDIYHALLLDARAIHQGDPASVSVDEVILAYPGFYAVAIYRIAHTLHQLGYPLLPRLLTEHAHKQTGVDIHPGATIGRSFFIDHGTGLVVGETAVIGNGVKLYQGVTLGALVVEKAMANRKRHPTLEDNVVVYANATILGGETVIGHDTVVGGNAWVTETVPAFSIVGRHTDVRPRRPASGEEIEFNI